MTGTMSTVALHLRNHGHGWPEVAVTMSAHFLGMFALVLVVGRLVDRIGRERSIIIGFLVLSAGAIALLAEVEIRWIAPAMLAVGLGWNVGFVAATAMMADATRPAERAGLLGFADFVAVGSSVVAALLAGVVIGAFGMAALAVIGTAVAMIPVSIFVVGRHRVQAAA